MKRTLSITRTLPKADAAARHRLARPACQVLLALLVLSLSLSAASAFAGEDARQSFKLALRSNASTGNFWRWTASGNGTVRETESGYEQSESLPGAPGRTLYTFVGEKEGEVVLRFVYSQSDTDQPNDRVNSYRLKVLADKRILLLEEKEDIVSKLGPPF